MPVTPGVGMTSARTQARLLQRLRDQGIHDPQILDAMRRVPRHLFVEEALASRAYEDVALPIGHGQTISQPFVVALMTQTISNGNRMGAVLEIGTGCGYQTAVLSLLADHVYSVERIGQLHRQARDRLFVLGYRNVTCLHGDGSLGWTEHAPYERILATAASGQVPPALLQQLTDGGSLVVPVGDGAEQTLMVIEREGDDFQHKELSQVRFVPLLSGKTEQ